MRLHRIDIAHQWKERHAHHELHLVEDRHGRIWLRLEDLRQWIPGLPAASTIIQRHPGMVRSVDVSNDAYLEANTFIWLTHRSSKTATLKLRSWLLTAVMEPAQRRHDRLGPRLSASGDSKSSSPHDVEHFVAVDQGSMAWCKAAAQVPFFVLSRWLNPFRWKWLQAPSHPFILAPVGLVGSFVALYLSGQLEAQAAHIENHYLAWSWAGMTVATWSVVINLAWIRGVFQSVALRSHSGFNFWTGLFLATGSLVAAAYMTHTTLKNSTQMMRVWHAIYVEGAPPISIDWVGGDEALLRLSGGMGIGSRQALREALATLPQVKTVELDSPGGLVVEGFGLLRLLQEEGVERTRVRNECASACTLLLMAAAQRELIGKGTIGFHRSYSVLGDMGTGWTDVEHQAADLMRSHGVTEAFIQRAFATPGSDMYEADVHELLASGVVTRVVEVP